MTNSPEPEAPVPTTPSVPGPASRPTEADRPAAVALPAEALRGTEAAQTDEPATFDRIVESRSESRLVLAEGVWHQISPRYVWVQLLSSGIVLALVVAATLVLALVFGQVWAYIPGGIFTVIMVWTLAILPRQARAIGYRLREDDLVFRRGILWQRFVAVPYGRMQLVDITHGPLDRAFGIAQLKFVTAAAATGVTIPGLPQATADTLRDHLVEVAESRRTGL